MASRLTSPLGLLILIAGIITLYLGYSGGDGTLAALGWVCLIVGTFLLIFGLHRFVSGFLNPPTEEIMEHGHAEVRLLIQCMGVMASADGKIDEKEVETIEEIHARMLGIRINSREVREILSEFDETFDIKARLKADRAKISPLMKRKIVQACHLVMTSDLEIRDSEVSKIHEIGEALGFSTTEIEQIVALAEI